MSNKVEATYAHTVSGEVIQRKPMTTAGELIKMLSELQLRRSE